MKRIVILLFLSGLCPAQPGIVWERTCLPGTTCSFPTGTPPASVNSPVTKRVFSLEATS